MASLDINVTTEVESLDAAANAVANAAALEKIDFYKVYDEEQCKQITMMTRPYESASNDISKTINVGRIDTEPLKFRYFDEPMARLLRVDSNRRDDFDF